MPKSQSKAAPNGTGHPDKGKTQEACYVLSLSVENVRCFGPKQTLDLSDGTGRPAQWTIILGENGTGKTTLLQLIVGFEEVDTTYDAIQQHAESRLTPRIFVRAGYDYLRRRGLDAALSARCSLELLRTDGLHSSSGRVYQADFHFDHATAGWEYIRLLTVFAYGAGRRLGRPAFGTGRDDDPVGTLFDEHATLRNAEEWLLRLDYSSSKPSDVRQQQKERLEQVKQLLVSILPDIEDIRFTMPTGPNPMPRVEFLTFSGWVPLRRLGYGYQTLIAWVTDFASRMVERYPDSPDPLKEPAVVVVDEIDLHLHPTWQRKLIGFLSERFPNTQFIATAHSPLVVQAAGNANLAVLKRVGDHVEIVNDVDEIRGWRVDQILTSDLFGLKSARPPEVEVLFARKQELLDKAKLTTREKAELQEIQDKIDKLRVGDTPQAAEEMEAIRKALELLTSNKPK